jgi:hypothetical protein
LRLRLLVAAAAPASAANVEAHLLDDEPDEHDDPEHRERNRDPVVCCEHPLGT